MTRDLPELSYANPNESSLHPAYVESERETITLILTDPKLQKWLLNMN